MKANKQQRTWAVLFYASPIVLVGILAYSNSFAGPFVFDDQVIVGSPILRDLSNFASPEAFFGGHAGVAPQNKFEYGLDPMMPNRPIGYLSFALNYWAHGTSVGGYHAVNLAIHIANALLVCAMMVLLLRTPRIRESRLASHTPTLAMICGLLFVAHPMQTQAVTYVVQRLASLAALFYLASMVLYLRSRLGTKTRWATVALYGASLLAALCAVRTKEHTLTLPAVMFVLELMFFDDSLRRRLVRLAPFLATALLIPLTMLSAGGPLTARLITDLSRSDYLLTQFTVIVSYLRLLLLPIGQNLDHDRVVYNSLLQLPVLSSFLLLLAIAGGGFLLLRLSRNRPELRLVSFGIAWFFLCLSPESSIVPIVDVMYEHRTYLPSFGFFLAIVIGGASLLRPTRAWGSRAMSVAIATLVLVLAASTYARNRVWQSRVSLWQDVTAKSPNKFRGHHNLGDAHRVEENNCLEAEKAFIRTLELAPRSSPTLNAMGECRRAASDESGALHYFTKALSADPNNALARFNCARSLESLRRFAEAVEQYELFLKFAERGDSKRIASALNSLGSLRLLNNDLAGAKSYYQRALEANPGFVPAQYNYARVLDALGERAEAAVQYEIFLRIAGDGRASEVAEAQARLRALRPER